MKITTKTTKEQIKAFLEDSLKTVTDNNLKDRIQYALEAEDDKVTKKDLGDLAKEVVKSLAKDLKTEPKAENSVKKSNKLKKSDKKAPEEPKTKTEKPEPEKSEPESEETEVSEEKKPAKKQKPKKSKVHEVVDEDFPEVLEIEGKRIDDDGETEITTVTTYELAHDIQSMEDLKKAVDNGEEIVFAFYYSKKMLKEAPYFYNMVEAPKSFAYDLDLAVTIYTSEELKVAYHISLYTEACYSTIPEDYEELDGVRYAGTMQYQIYRTVSTQDKTEA